MIGRAGGPGSRCRLDPDELRHRLMNPIKYAKKIREKARWLIERSVQCGHERNIVVEKGFSAPCHKA